MCVLVSNTFLDSLRLRLGWRIYQGLGVFLSHSVVEAAGRGAEAYGAEGALVLAAFAFLFSFVRHIFSISFYAFSALRRVQRLFTVSDYV